MQHAIEMKAIFILTAEKQSHHLLALSEQWF
jgi:hypothetical protein